jgi:hypothetical protein
MDEKLRFKKIVDALKETVKREGKPITNELIADELDYSREHFQRLYTGNGTVKEKHVKDLLFRFPEMKEMAQNISPELVVKEHNATYATKEKKRPSGTENAQQINALIEATVKLSDSVLIGQRNVEQGQKNIDRLLNLLEANSHGSKVALATDPSFAKLIDLLWEVAKSTGKWQENEFRAMVSGALAEGSVVSARG